MAGGINATTIRRELCEETALTPSQPIPEAQQGQPFFQEAKINKVANGFIVKIGCQTFVSQDWEKLSKALGEFWDNPIEAQKKYCK